jgi:hypothetical protein
MQELRDPTGTRFNPAAPPSCVCGRTDHTTTEHTRTVRARLAAMEKCDEGCPGWGVFHVAREPGLEIESCDACTFGTDPRLTDDDVAILDEAQWALAACMTRLRRLRATDAGRLAPGEEKNDDTTTSQSTEGGRAMKPICVTCKLFFRPEKNGTYFEEGMPVGRTQHDKAPKEWQPYKLWSGDKWKCRGCGAEIIVGTGREPLAEHWRQPDYAQQVARLNPEFRVDDC